MAKLLDNKHLLMEVQQRIAMFEEAIRQIGITKKQLQQNAMEAKGDIHTAMSRQLERLRSREVWLLSQVDLVAQAKDAVLAAQEDRLHQALGGLNDIMDIGPGLFATANGEDHVTETLSRLNMMDLRPDETPHVGFRANPAALREEIHGFGRVDAKGLPLDVFMDRDLMSASLPPAVEEYEDEDHHVLYKTVENVTEAPEKRIRQVNINFPRLSQSPQDWLFLPTDIQPPTSPRPEDKYCFPPFLSGPSVQDWLVNHGQSVMTDGASSQASIQQWLCDIHNQAVLEEEEDDGGIDFEMVPSRNVLAAESAAASSSIEVLSIDDIHPQMMSATDDVSDYTPTHQGEPLLQYFQEVRSKSMSDWLLDGAAIRASHEFGSSYPYQTMKYFREISQNTKDWLLQYQEKHREENQVYELCKPEKCNSSCCSSGTATPTRVAMDIENLDQLVCIQDSVSRYFHELSSDSTQWLLKKKDEDLDLDELEIIQKEEVDVKRVCRANEVCGSFADCVCDEVCCSQNVEASEGLKSSSFCKVSPEPVHGSPKFDYFRTVSDQRSDWLCPGINREEWSPNCPIRFAPFKRVYDDNEWLLCSAYENKNSAQSRLSDNSSWLMPSRQNSEIVTTECAFPVFKKEKFAHNKSDSDAWLATNQSQSQVPRIQLTNWQMPTTHPGSKNVPNLASKWLKNNTELPTSAKHAPSEIDKMFQSVLKGQENSSWVLETKLCEMKGKDVSKQAELPECADDSASSVSESKSYPHMDTDFQKNPVLFTCFEDRGLALNTWLLNAKI